ncbi:DUF3221 domain-containing protein [Sporosarcina sp. UB5]|uniref:DUF3221 domain-containing protein n=1 Tax=Sporosarcina sp. UB5 TaxID=3047463 RepID=UPI003D79F9C5
MKHSLIILLGAVMLLGGCGTSEIDGTLKSGSVVASEWEMLKLVSDREIIAELKQTAKETPARDKAVAAQADFPEFEGQSKEHAEDMAVQMIEGPAAMEAMEKVYGPNGIYNDGVIFFENQSNGAEQSGIWIGIKNPDERVQQLLDQLQPKVDAGEILAEPIYIFRSPHTEKELNDLQEEVAAALKGMYSKKGSYGLYVNTITGDIEITHDFLKKEQQDELKQLFVDHTINFTQDGKLVAEPGESSIIEPKETFTDSPVDDGGFILSAGEGQIFVAGGTEGATYYKFPEADKLKVGQRVKVEASGGIMESYPAQGTAKFVEVMPNYKPVNAEISESEAVAKVLEMDDAKSEMGFVLIDDVTYDEKEMKWIFTVLKNEGEATVEVEDQ